MNFDWKNKNDKEPDEEQEAQKKIVESMLIADWFERLYAAFDWFALGLLIYNIFAWLWKAKNAHCALALLFIVLAAERVAMLFEYMMTPEIIVDDGDDEEDDNDEKGKMA